MANVVSVVIRETEIVTVADSTPASTASQRFYHCGSNRQLRWGRGDREGLNVLRSAARWTLEFGW
jgi:hypothetical protein